LFGADMRFLPFTKETMFFHLFLIIYSLLYGLNSPIVSKRPNNITIEQKQKILEAAKRIENKEAPPEVVQSVARRTTNPNSRRSVYQYFCKEVGLA